jgi:hypothetical protein
MSSATNVTISARVVEAYFLRSGCTMIVLESIHVLGAGNFGAKTRAGQPSLYVMNVGIRP